MTASTPLPPDRLAPLVSPEHQRQAARMAQDAFARIFRLTLAGDAPAVDSAVGDMIPLCRNWAHAGGSDEARALRLALLVSGLDQWGLAYAQAFGLTAIPALSALLGELRTGLDPAADARFEKQFAAIAEAESDAVDFKMELRRNIHLALWHAMIASEAREEADAILLALGSQMRTLVEHMPELGWRLVADAMAHIQVRCLSDGLAADGPARESNERFFTSLRRALPGDTAAAVFAQANRAAVSWQRARNAGSIA